jgi:LysM domain
MDRRLVVRGTAVIVLAVAAAALLSCALGFVAEAQSGPASYETLLGLAAAAVAATCLVWLAGSALLIVLASLPGAFAYWIDGVAQRLAPIPWRRTVHLALGVAVLAAPISSATAWADGHSVRATAPDEAGGCRPNPPSLDRPAPDPASLPPVDRPVEAPATGQLDRSELSVQPPGGHPRQQPTTTPPTPWMPAPPPGPTHTTPAADPLLTGRQREAVIVAEDVVVHRGDTLWHIAARHLGPEASAAEIATEWPRWWSANRSVIGDDPDLILPGQRLRPPS